ncbi:peptidylprolyl isomerase [Corallococcus terminator]|uniref:Peptidylprolyl isomerase n=1 Tax=Corallococcus terminator TaxID=2316733 RepID=A0A3A8JCL4_9BACT|nr:peptidylprolyl isomerase [Corallococcus terminator]RKG89590.1 peptidylprolyl isomerase [Corallococcus terminator]
MSPIASLMAAGPVSLPEAKAPSLEGLAVKVPLARDLTPEDLITRFHEKKRERATVRARAEGEHLAAGDDVQLNVLGYADGRLIPFSARFGQWMELAPLQALPGFAEGLAEGGTVGGSLQLMLDLPDDYPVESLRGKTVRFLVDVRAAREVTMPDEEAPGFLKQLALGDSLDAVMDHLQEELEQELSDSLWVQAQELVLEELARRTEVEIPRKLVDEEIRRRWAAAEGFGMVEQNFSVEEQEEAVQGWLTDPATREQAERRIRIGLGLKAVAERDQLTLTPQKLQELLEESTEPFGLTAADVSAALRESPETTKRLHDMGWHLMVVEHVMSKARVTFEGAEQG